MELKVVVALAVLYLSLRVDEITILIPANVALIKAQDPFPQIKCS